MKKIDAQKMASEAARAKKYQRIKRIWTRKEKILGEMIESYQKEEAAKAQGVAPKAAISADAPAATKTEVKPL